jgi:DNA-binding NarL/FixJ family response regulator
MKSVVIVEDQTAVREMIAQVIDLDPTLSVIAQCGDGREALEICVRQMPDFVIMDVMLPGMNGPELMRRLAKQLHSTRVLVFSGYYSPQLVREMIQAGAHGFVEKTAPLSELKNAIAAVSNGGNYYGPEVAKIVHQTLLNPGKALGPGVEDLTPREREIIKLIATGSTTKDVAARLNISLKTAENHRANLMRKLDLHNAASLTHFALEQGLIERVRGN